ncbi:GAF domain-containing SpoIIE family protein phosphatase [Curtobacterium sp. CFBP9011]|uniref:GAF domain-containing SpoIIE family protein phosphatase n=1 Tax=Curtobacterium sp. CFBP9011 TaxID=3096530 RepID=UPI002A6AE703|nr:GAF domain-containing SpoIIE family protein phosphatase [Curtobacterium sp. CFBP9011]MDY1005612.1 GAF domain-containing SpoIIE family protein phosphatase [Curtobacterium sp. CFBP9011]
MSIEHVEQHADQASAPETARRAALLAALDVVQSGPEERFERITRIAREAFGVAGSFLNLAGDDLLFHKSQQSDAVFPGSTPLRDTFCGRTLHQDGPVVVADARDDQRFSDLPMVNDDPNVRFYAGVPLHVGADATKVGTLCLIDPEPRTLTADDVVLLQELAVWAERELATGLDDDRIRAVLTGLQPRTVDLPGWTIGGTSIPYGIVSGDFHEWRVAGDTVDLTVADVMGKGMAAGLLAAGMRGALLARCNEVPPTAVAALEEQVAPDLSAAEAFATLFHGRLDTTTGRLDFVDAGHGLVLHLHADGTETVLRSVDLPIGLHPVGIDRAVGQLVLEPGDSLVLVSDGALELWDSTLASLSRLGALYRKSSDLGAFLAGVRGRAIEHDPGDDLTVVVVSRDA